MQLSQWCTITGKSKKDIAAQIGDVSPRSVFRWANSERFPKPKDLIKIYTITDGAVTANDFVKQWAVRYGQEE